VTNFASKNATVHKAEKFHSKLTKLQDARSALETKEQPTNEDTFESKKETVASVTLEEVASVPAIESNGDGSETRYIKSHEFVPQIKNEFPIFDQ